MHEKFDLTGKRFGKLTALKCVGSDGQGRIWRCKCDCGKVKNISAKHLTRNVKSCGCSRLNMKYQSRQVCDTCENDGFLGLRTAILFQAAMDYRQGNEQTKKSIERFFLSDWGQFISGDMGEVIIEKLRKEEDI